MRSALLHIARALGLFALARWVTRERLRILCYHGAWIGPQPHYGDRLFMSGETFAARMRWLQAKGYRVRRLDDALAGLAQGRIRPRDVVLTFDDAWRGFEQRMLPVLHELGWPSTLYVPTSSVLSGDPVWPVLSGYLVARASPAQKARLEARVPAGKADEDLETRVARWLGSASPDERPGILRQVGAALDVDVESLAATGAFSLMSPGALRDARDRGVDIQLHTHGHSMHDMDPARVRDEIETNRLELARVLDVAPDTLRHFCYPSGEHDRALIPVLRSAGVASATTTEFGLARTRDSSFLLPRLLDGEGTSLIEFEARLSGFWGWLEAARGWARGRRA
jgi:peptidoglycan/xylan/chitin deacetylase (PgdA/CDA1 family)